MKVQQVTLWVLVGLVIGVYLIKTYDKRGWVYKMVKSLSPKDNKIKPHVYQPSDNASSRKNAFAARTS